MIHFARNILTNLRMYLHDAYIVVQDAIKNITFQNKMLNSASIDNFSLSMI